MSKVRILVADDHPGVRERVEDILQPTFEVVGTVCNGKALVETALKLQLDVIISMESVEPHAHRDFGVFRCDTDVSRPVESVDYE